MKPTVKWYAVLDTNKNDKYHNKVIKNKKVLICEKDAIKSIETHISIFYWKENKITISEELPCKVIKETINIEEF